MLDQEDTTRLAARCCCALPLAGARLGAEYGYQSVALCLIDAIWSIGVRYESVTNVIRCYCDHLRTPVEVCTASLAELIEDMAGRGVEFYTSRVFQNRHRTSPRSGILKADAVLRGALVLLAAGIDQLSDVPRILPDPVVEDKFRSVPGQGSGLSLQYFLMLAGNRDRVKPDRMVLRFVESVLGRAVGPEEVEQLLIETVSLLKPEHPDLDARLLDHLIWRHQRSVGSGR